MARGRWYRLADDIWRWTDPGSGTPSLKKIRFFQVSSGLWRRAAKMSYYRAATGLWYVIRTGFLPQTPTDTPAHAYLTDLSVCTNPAPRTETWLFRAAFTISDATYSGNYNLETQFYRGGVAQGWVDRGTNFATAVNCDLQGSWSAGAPHGTLGTGAGYATVLWGIEARFRDIDSGIAGPSNGDSGTNNIALVLPYC